LVKKHIEGESKEHRKLRKDLEKMATMTSEIVNLFDKISIEVLSLSDKY
jgi:hypothetical protein